MAAEPLGPLWEVLAGSVGWSRIPDGFVIFPTFWNRDAFESFDSRIRAMDDPKIVATIIEHDMYYDLVFYEESGGGMPDVGFIMARLSRQGYYKEFSREYGPGTRMMFSYTKSIRTRARRPRSNVKMMVKFEFEPFDLADFRIARFEDVWTDDGSDPGGGFHPEALAMLGVSTPDGGYLSPGGQGA